MRKQGKEGKGGQKQQCLGGAREKAAGKFLKGATVQSKPRGGHAHSRAAPTLGATPILAGSQRHWEVGRPTWTLVPLSYSRRPRRICQWNRIDNPQAAPTF